MFLSRRPQDVNMFKLLKGSNTYIFWSSSSNRFMEIDKNAKLSDYNGEEIIATRRRDINVETLIPITRSHLAVLPHSLKIPLSNDGKVNHIDSTGCSLSPLQNGKVVFNTSNKIQILMTTEFGQAYLDFVLVDEDNNYVNYNTNTNGPYMRHSGDQRHDNQSRNCHQMTAIVNNGKMFFVFLNVYRKTTTIEKYKDVSFLVFDEADHTNMYIVVPPPPPPTAKTSLVGILYIEESSGHTVFTTNIGQYFDDIGENNSTSNKFTNDVVEKMKLKFGNTVSTTTMRR